MNCNSLERERKRESVCVCDIERGESQCLSTTRKADVECSCWNLPYHHTSVVTCTMEDLVFEDKFQFGFTCTIPCTIIAAVQGSTLVSWTRPLFPSTGCMEMQYIQCWGREWSGSTRLGDTPSVNIQLTCKPAKHWDRVLREKYIPRYMCMSRIEHIPYNIYARSFHFQLCHFTPEHTKPQNYKLCNNLQILAKTSLPSWSALHTELDYILMLRVPSPSRCGFDLLATSIYL